MDGPWLPDPQVAGRKKRAYLFCFLDDHSRLVPYAEFFWDEALPRMERVLKVGILRPRAAESHLCGQWPGVCRQPVCGGLRQPGYSQRIHTAPYAPEGEGKTGAFFQDRALAVHARSGSIRDCHPG